MAASVLEVLITGDATSLKLAFTQATAATEEYAAATTASSAATKEASATATAFGQSSSRAFTYAKLGALAFAAVSVKAAIDFNREFTLIAAVTNTASDRIDAMKSSVMDLSHQTGVAPTELAHAMYFLASAGLTATQQMQALTAVAKGTAIGLGDAGDLARIEANALNAFADQGLTASQVMDALTAAIRAGTAEPDEFAASLGRILPVADQAGISFNSVVASLSAMSNAGLDVNEGVTSMRATLQSLIAPTAQTTTAFGKMGLTVTDVVASMQGNGFLATIRMVSDAAKKATDSQGEYNQMMRHAIPNIRGLVGALNLTHQEAAKVDEVFRQVANSLGSTDEAFKTTAESSAFKVTQAFNDIKIAGMNLAADVLPLLASVLEVAARNANILVGALVAFGVAKFVAPMLRDIAAANMQLAASEEAAGGAAIAQAAAMQSSATGSVAGLVRFPAIGAASSVGAHQLMGEMAGAAANSTQTFKEMGLAVSGSSNAITSLGNAIESKGLPQLFALVQGVIDAKHEIDAFKQEGITGALQSFAASGTASLFSNVPVVGGVIKAFQDAVSQGPDTQHFTEGIQAVNDTLAASAKTAPEKAAIIQNAIASIGGNLTVDNIDAYVTAIQQQLDAEAQQKAQADAVKAANLELTKQTQAAMEATDSWQKSTAAMTDHLSGLSRVGIDVTSFMSQLQSDLASSDDQAKTFGDAIDTVTKAWTDFKTQAQDALFFIPSALADVTSAAEQAQTSLANMAPPAADLHGQDLQDYNDQLATLQGQAHLTGNEILTAFQKANHESRTFFQNLMDISKAGKAGKDLATLLLQTGNTTAAATIASADNEKQIIKTFGTGQDMADKFGTQITDAIVGPLDDITRILANIARKQFGINLGFLNDGGKKTKKQADDVKHSLHQLTDRQHEVGVSMKDQKAQTQVDHLQDSVHNLSGDSPYPVNFKMNDKQMQAALHNFDTNLDTFTSKERLIKIGVHIFPKSPWPDEAMKTHLSDPMKKMGFKRVGDTYTLPLDVGMHSDGSGAGGQGKPNGLNMLRELERRQLNVLFDIRHELKTLNVVQAKHASGSGDGSGSSGSGGSGGSSSGGGSSSSTAISGHLGKLVKEFQGFVDKVQGPMYAKRWAEEMTKALNKPGVGQQQTLLLKQAMRDMAKATNAAQAHAAADEFRKASHALDEKHLQAQQDARKQWFADALKFADTNVPRLPAGHTNISVNHHERNRRAEVVLDRKRFTDSASYDIDYARGF